MEHNMNYIAHEPAQRRHHGAPHSAATAPPRRAAAAGAPSAPCLPALPGGHGGQTPQSPAAAARRSTAHGTAHDAPCDLGTRVDPEYVLYRLEEAGTALLALPSTGYTTRMRTGSLEVVHTALEAYGWDDAKLRPLRPDAARISRMDEALGWIVRIPHDRYVLRRIVGARALVSPTTERHLYPWRRLGALLGADHKAVQRWHAQGIALIVASLNGA